MEVLLGFLYVNKFILNLGGSFDLLYSFTACLVVYFLFTNRGIIVKSISMMLPFIFIAFIDVFVIDRIDKVEILLYLAKMFLNLILMNSVASKGEKINTYKIIYWISFFVLINTSIAMINPNGVFWRTNDVVNGFSKTRLQLTYIEPSELAFHIGIVLLAYFVLYINKTKLYFRDYVFIFVLFIDILLSAGMGGIIALSFSIILVLFYKMIDSKWIISKKMFLTIIIAIIGIMLVFLTNNKFILRLVRVLNGNDSSFYSRYTLPLIYLAEILPSTKGIGCGLGNLNSNYGQTVVGYVFPNSFLYFIAEAGYAGILILLMFIIIMIIKCIKHHDYIALAFFSYCVIYQIPGGYFTNPTNFIVYGLVLLLLKQNVSNNLFSGEKIQYEMKSIKRITIGRK